MKKSHATSVDTTGFSIRLRQALANKKMQDPFFTQRTIGEHLKTTEQAVSHWFRPGGGMPDNWKIIRLAELLGADPCWLAWEIDARASSDAYRAP